MRRSFIKQHSMTLPVIRSQLDYVLRNGVNSSFEDYTNHLHESAVNAYRRSIVPTPENVKGEKLLHNIKKVKNVELFVCYKAFLNDLKFIAYQDHGVRPLPLPHFRGRPRNF